MDKQEGLPLTTEDMLNQMGIVVEKEIPPDENSFEGYIKIKGPTEKVTELIVQMAISTYPGSEDRYKRANLESQIRRGLNEGNFNMDVDISGEEGAKKMVRVVSMAKPVEGILEVNLGGGGNRTTFSEMEEAFNQAVLKAFEVLNMPSGSKFEAPRIEEDIVITNIFRWVSYDPQTNRGGYGFVKIVGPDDKEKRVFIPGRNLFPPINKGETPKGQLVIRKIDINWNNPKGPSVDRAFLGMDAYQRWSREEKKRREEEEKARLEREVARRQEQERKERIKKLNELLEGKLEKVEGAYPLEFGRGNSLDFIEAVTATPPLSKLLFLRETFVWPIETIGPSRWMAKSSQLGRGELCKLVVIGTDFAQKRGRISPSNDLVLVRISARARPTEEVVGEPISFKDFDATCKTFFLKPASSDQEYVSVYRVSLEDAQKIWNYIEWWRLPLHKLRRAILQAKKIQEAKRIWNDEFPNIKPGDMVGAADLVGIPPWSNEYQFWTTSDIVWVNRCFWEIPPYLTDEEDEILGKRKKILTELAEKGDEGATKLLEEEA